MRSHGETRTKYEVLILRDLNSLLDDLEGVSDKYCQYLLWKRGLTYKGSYDQSRLRECYAQDICEVQRLHPCSYSILVPIWIN